MEDQLDQQKRSSGKFYSGAKAILSEAKKSNADMYKKRKAHLNKFADLINDDEFDPSILKSKTRLVDDMSVKRLCNI